MCNPVKQPLQLSSNRQTADPGINSAKGLAEGALRRCQAVADRVPWSGSEQASLDCSWHATPRHLAALSATCAGDLSKEKAVYDLRKPAELPAGARLPMSRAWSFRYLLARLEFGFAETVAQLQTSTASFPDAVSKGAALRQQLTALFARCSCPCADTETLTLLR